MGIVGRVKRWNRTRLAQLRDAREALRTIDLGVLGIMKNEELNVVEWIDHQFWIGAGRVYLIDNGSTDRSVELVRSHPRAADIDLIILPEPYKQLEHYETARRKFRILETCKWLLVCDLDEFLFHREGKKIPEYLAGLDYQDLKVNLVYLNWKIFGASGNGHHPDSLRRDLISCRDALENHNHTKWFVRSQAASRKDIHFGVHKISGIDSGTVVSECVALQLNHYVTQSRHYFETVKMTRGDSVFVTNHRDWQYFEDANRGCTVLDTTLRDLLAADNTAPTIKPPLAH